MLVFTLTSIEFSPSKVLTKTLLPKPVGSKTKPYFLVCQPPPAGARFSFTQRDIRGMPIIHTGGRSVNLVDRSFVPAGSTVIRI